MSIRNLKLLLRLVLHHLLFLLYWIRIRSSLSIWAGLIIFSAIWFCLQAVLSGKARRLPAVVLSTLLILLIFPITRILSLPAVALPLPWDFLPLIFHSYYVLVFPVLAILLWVSTLGDRFHWFVFVEFTLYAWFFSLLLGKKGWTMDNPFTGHMVIAFILLAGAFLFILLLFLSGRIHSRLSLRKELPPILFIMILLLVPAGRLYKAESLKEGGGLLESSFFNFDFAPFLTLESKISMKDELVFLMQKEGPAEELYLRRFILGGYNREKGFFYDGENTFETPETVLPDYMIPEGALRWEIPAYAQRQRVSQSFYYVNFDGSAFLGMNTPESVIPYFSWEDSSFSRIYQVDSLISRVGPWELIDGDYTPGGNEPDAQDFYDFYTDYGDQEDLKALAQEITGDLPGRFLQATAIQDYLQQEYLYSLAPGTSPKGDQLRYFLFESKKGYCSYFAFSMTLLCRSLGIPARVALGFWVDTESALLNFYPVNANQAHAWVEVYFPEYGWIEFDPTSRTLAPGEDFEFTSYNPDELEPYIQEILANKNHLTVISGSPEGAAETFFSRFQKTWKEVAEHPERILLFTCLFLVFFRVLVLFSLFRGLPANRKRAGTSYRIHRRLVLSLFRAEGLIRMSPQELGEFCAEKGLVRFHAYTQGYQALRFSPDPPDLKGWFLSSRDVRREMAGTKGRIPYWLSLVKLIFLPRERDYV